MTLTGAISPCKMVWMAFQAENLIRNLCVLNSPSQAMCAVRIAYTPYHVISSNYKYNVDSTLTLENLL